MRNLLVVLILLAAAYSSFAQPVLTNVSQAAGVVHKAVKCDLDMPAQGGAAWFDYDNDGWYDLYLTGGSAADALFRNNGDGTFTDKTAEAGLALMANVFTDGVTTGDVNRDGWNDILVTTFRTAGNYLFLNNGDGTFTPQLNWAGAQDTANSFSATFADLNMDGWLDLYICNWSRYMNTNYNGGFPFVDSEANFYYENNGDGTFTERAEELGIDDTLGCALGVIITDIDNDNDPDIFVANDFGFFYGNTPNRLFRNEYPQSTFVEVSNSLGLDTEQNGMGVARTDMNADGVFDFYITNIRSDKLLVSSVTGYEEETVARGLRNDSVWLQDFSDRHWNVGWGAGFLDIDNDMDEDLMVANGSLSYEYPWPSLDSNKLFLNDGNGYFEDISRQTGIADTYVSRALAYCDYDGDGDLDVFVGITDTVNGINHSFLYRNDSPPRNWLQVKATGVENNTNGIGAKVVAYTNGQFQMREIGGESSFNSQHWQVAHFGLGNHTVVDSLQIIWYGGVVNRYYNLPANQFIEVIEGQGVITAIHTSQEETVQVYPNPFTHQLHLEGTNLASAQLFDVNGKLLVATSTKQGNQLVLNVAALATGNYLLRATHTNGQTTMRKVTKQ